MSLEGKVQMTIADSQWGKWMAGGCADCDSSHSGGFGGGKLAQAVTQAPGGFLYYRMFVIGESQRFSVCSRWRCCCLQMNVRMVRKGGRKSHESGGNCCDNVYFRIGCLKFTSTKNETTC